MKKKCIPTSLILFIGNSKAVIFREILISAAKLQLESPYFWYLRKGHENIIHKNGNKYPTNMGEKLGL